MSHIPELNAMGVYTLLAPWDTALLPKTMYRCVSLRKPEDYAAGALDAFKVIYEPKDLPVTKYREDVAAGVVMVTLEAIGTTQTVIVPSAYITGMPVVNGVPYTEMAMSFTLGAIPHSMDLGLLKTRIATLVKETLGITSEVHVLAVSPTTLLSQADHKSVQLARDQATVTTPSERVRALAAETKCIALQRTIDELMLLLPK